MKTVKEISRLIGGTPLYQMQKLTTRQEGTILGKLEFMNPGGSIKDRIALGMIERAQEEGQLVKGGTIVEATIGNTGIGLAMVANVKNYHLILVMPETLSEGKRNTLQAYGAQLVFTPAEKGMLGAVLRAQELVEQNSDYYMPQQFHNPANPETHRQTTGPEILKQTGGRIDAFVAGVGTGGTLTGVGEVLKEYNPMIQVLAVEPASSPILSGGMPGPTKIPGIGAGFIPPILNQGIYDGVITVKEEEALKNALLLAQREGLLAGISSGANLAAARKVARKLGKGSRVVTILPDRGAPYIYLYGSATKRWED